MTRYMIRGGCVLTLGARTPNYTKADVVVDEGRIVEIGMGLRARNAEVIEAEDAIVMPGFIDTHRHAWRSLFRNYGEGREEMGPELSPAVYGPHYEPDDVYTATLIGLLGAARSGTTTVVDWADAATSTEHASAALQAHADSGLRTVRVTAPPVWLADGDFTAPSPDPSPRASVAHGIQSASAGQQPAAEYARARESGSRIHAHVGTDPTQRGVIAAMGDAGLLGADVTLVHCSHVDDSDLDAIAKSGAGVSLTPSSEMAGGLGAPPIQGLIDRGIRPGLGVDDERVAPGDMFAQMRATNSIQHASTFDLKLAGKAGLPTLLTTRDVIRYATIDGASSIGMDSDVGSLEVGKQADVLILRVDRPNIAPINDPIGAVVWGMDTSNVDWVLVGGEAIVANGDLVADVADLREKAMAAQRAVASRAGLMAGVGLAT